MTKHYIFLFIGLLLTSCATIFNSNLVDITIHSDTDSVKVCLAKDTTRWFVAPCMLFVERSRNDLHLIAQRDSIQDQINVKSRLSNAFLFGNLFSMASFFGYAIDLTNQRRFTYPPDITINFSSANNLKKKYQTWRNPVKGLLSFKLSFPEGNHFYLYKGNRYGNTFGFLGLSGGIEYYFTDKYCISSDIGALTNFMIPFPAPIDYFGPREISNALYGNIQLGSDFRKLHYGCGIQYNNTSYNKWDTLKNHYVDTLSYYHRDTLIYHKDQNNIGLSFSTYYLVSNSFNIGLAYYPSFLSWNNKGLELHYNHLLFLELIFKYNIYRPKH